MRDILIKTEDLCKSFIMGKTGINVLKNLNIEIYKGDFTVIMGSSGSGKSTLLYSLSTMDAPTSGKINLFGKNISNIREKEASFEKEEKLKIAEKELLACISHDLKTLITNIHAYCEGILDGIVKEERDIKRYANVILNKSKAITKMLDDMLEVSKAEINKMTIKKEAVYTEEFFKSLVEEI